MGVTGTLVFGLIIFVIGLIFRIAKIAAKHYQLGYILWAGSSILSFVGISIGTFYTSIALIGAFI